MPGNYEPLDLFVREISDAGVGHVLCLVSDEEIGEKSPHYLKAIRQGKIPARLWRHDIPEYGLPVNRSELIQVIESMRQLLAAGESVVIHCAAGIGRTGMVAIMLLMRMGFSLHVASRTIQQSGSKPDTSGQWEFVQDLP